MDSGGGGGVQVHQVWGHLAGCEMSWPGGTYNQVLNCGSTQTQGGGVQSFLT